MKGKLYLVVMCVFMVNGMLKADYPEIAIASGSGLANPDIDDGLVAWQGGSISTGTDIYWKTFADPNDPNTVLLAGEQILPAVSGATVVWEDQRFGTSNTEIYWQDVTMVGDPSYPMGLTIANRQKAPAVSGDVMVWHDRRSADDPEVTTSYDIYGYNNTTDTHLQICTETTNEYESAISGNIVVWRDGRDDGYAGNDIYMCDLSVMPFSPEAVNPCNVDQYRPAIDGSVIVWEEIGTTTVDLVAYDISISEEIWRRTIPLVQANLDISGSIVVWQEDSVGDCDIAGYDLVSGVDYMISTGNEDDQNPAISGRRVVWQRNGTNIVGAEIPTPTQIAVLTPNGGEMFLAGTQILITWELVEGTPPDYVNIEFLNESSDPNLIAEDIPFVDFEYLWMPIADVNSIDACRIRVSDISDAAVSDLSNAVFSIFRCDSQLTADLTGDCFVGMEDVAEMAGQWLVCGNPYDRNWCFE